MYKQLFGKDFCEKNKGTNTFFVATYTVSSNNPLFSYLLFKMF